MIPGWASGCAPWARPYKSGCALPHHRSCEAGPRLRSGPPDNLVLDQRRDSGLPGGSDGPGLQQGPKGLVLHRVYATCRLRLGRPVTIALQPRTRRLLARARSPGAPARRSTGTLAASTVWGDPARRVRLTLIIVAWAVPILRLRGSDGCRCRERRYGRLVLAEAARLGSLSGWSGEGRARELMVDEVAGDFGELTVVVAGVGPQ
jgi:hypothetical protein